MAFRGEPTMMSIVLLLDLLIKCRDGKYVVKGYDMTKVCH